jgi:putative flippase GtrA
MKRLMKQFLCREAHPAVQFVKYAIGGALATAVDVLVFYLVAIWLLPALAPGDPAARLLGLSVSPIAEAARSAHYVWDKIIAFMFSNFTAYVVNALWVFTPGRHSKRKEFALFYAVSATSFVLGTALGWLLIKWAGLPTTYAFVANGVASLALNYAGRKFVVFKG